MKKKILLAEDESIVRMDTSMMLQDAGFDVVGEAEDGEKAISLAHQLEVDLIIMDIKMPNLGGLKASKIIGDKYNVPILLLTAYSQKEYIEKAKEANIVGYIVKPVSEEQFIPSVEMAIHQGEVSEKYRDEVNKADQRLEERKIIEQAKGILIDQFGYTEDSSFKKIRKISMNKQMNLEKVARRIIKKYS
ncbi:response regulator [Pontibacillus yanchengensis]|uniref:Response regulator n=2 Tax=Pontibacillus yanchengensis TaxID=462910 RepID=A0ACC7VKX9_9BACI|nr:response regulator [Pontibacillus yanchengensis]MYL35756.1 response regulator [Pontibacillus yanchengensis]MYL55467.1 response regulator [Pontibacillus yanchengensis]